MVFFIVFPVLAFSYLVLIGVFRKLLTPACSRKIRIATVILIISGGLTGIWTGNYLNYKVSKEIQLIGLPVPKAIVKNDEMGAYTNEMPDWIRWLGQLANPVCGVAVFLIPIRLHLIIHELTEEQHNQQDKP